MNEKEFVGQCFSNKLHGVPDTKTSMVNIVDDIAFMITTPGIINITKEDIQKIADSSNQVIGVSAEAKGRYRAEKVGHELVSHYSSATEYKADSVIFSVIGSPDLTLYEVNEIADQVYRAVNPRANITFGAMIDESKTDYIKTTVIFGSN